MKTAEPPQPVDWGSSALVILLASLHILRRIKHLPSVRGTVSQARQLGKDHHCRAWMALLTHHSGIRRKGHDAHFRRVFAVRYRLIHRHLYAYARSMPKMLRARIASRVMAHSTIQKNVCRNRRNCVVSATCSAVGSSPTLSVLITPLLFSIILPTG